MIIQQGSPEWHELRSTRMTASHAQAIATNGKGLKTYVREKMCALFSTGEQISYTNANMENGLEREEIAAMLYEFETGNKTEIIGFEIYNDYIGASPDRLVGNEGLIEIKSPTDKVYFNLLLDKKIDTKHEWQMQMQTLVCKRAWCDYVVYNPNFKQQLFIKRVFADKEKFAKLEIGFESGIKMIKEIKKEML